MKLKEILDGCLFTDGDWIESKDQDPNGEIRLIQLADIGDGFFVDKSSRFINRDTAKRLRCTFLEKNDILIARMPDPLGRACVFPLEENEKYVTAVDVCIIRTNENCNNRYLQYCLNSTDIRNSIERQKTGTTRERITRKKLGELDIPFPPLPQQQKIANILDAADALRQNDKALIAKYDELTQALFLDMFGDPVSNPKGWEKVKLGLVTNMRAGKFIAASDIFSENKNDMYSCYGGNGLRGFVKSHTHEGEFVLIGRQGALCGNVKIANGKFHATEHAIVCSPVTKYKAIWLYYLLKMMDLNRFSTGAAQPGLNVGTLVELEIMIVPYNLQNQFAERVAVIEEQKAIAQKSLEKSESLFNSLLQKAFKGELV